MTQVVADWLVGLGLDSTPLEQGLKKVDGIFKKLEKNNISSNNVVKDKIDKQTKSLKQQEKVVSKIKKASQDVGIWSPNLIKIDRQEKASAKRTRADFAANQKIKEKEIYDLQRERIKALRKERKEEEDQRKRVDSTQSSLDKQREKERAAARKEEEDQRKRVRQFELNMDRQRNREMAEAERRRKAKARSESTLGSSKYSLSKDMYILGEQLPRKFAEGSEKLTEFNRRLAILRHRLAKAGDTNAIRKIRTDLAVARREANMFASDLSKIKKKQSLMEFTTKRLSSSLLNLAGGFASVFAVMRIAGSMYETAKSIDSTKAALLASAGSAVQAGKDFQFVKRVAMSLGTDLQSGAKAFAQVAVAGKEAGMQSQEIKELFVAVQEGATAFGLSADDAYGLVRALTQSISKGTVMAEELRLQMGKIYNCPFIQKCMSINSLNCWDTLRA